MYKMHIVEDGYIVSVGKISKMTEDCIDDASYGIELRMLTNPPTAPEGKAYRLKSDLTWELYDMPIPEPTPITPEDLYTAMEGIL